MKEQALKHRANRIKNGELSVIEGEACNDDSIISRPEEAILILEEDIDEYDDENDLGYEVY